MSPLQPQPVAGASWPLEACLALAAAAILLSAVLVRRMIRFAVMDVPGARSAHDRPIPKGGGVGTVTVLLLGTPAVMALLPGGHARWPAAALLLSALVLLAVVSWLDDVRQFGYRAKLGAQVAAAVLVTAAALVTIRTMPPWPLLALLAPLAVAWLMLTTNAMNFIDGLNGLASGSTAIVCAVGAWLGWSLGDPLLFAVMLLATAGLLGFLPFNYPRARIFLGDVGSQPAGLLAGALALMVLADGGGWRAMLVPLMLAGVLWDVLLTLGRRTLAGQRLAQAHRDHLYQRAARRLLPASTVSAVHWGFVVWGTAAGLVVPCHPTIAAIMVVVPQIPWTIRAWR